MSYITTDNLTNIMAEMTDYCNAACPMCNRFDWDFNLVKGFTNTQHTTLEFVKQRIGEEIISRLNGWECQGTYGDALMNPETLDIFRYLREINPNLHISMHTNGGARTTEFWKSLAELDVKIMFGIDGLEDTNHLYRRNVKWQKLMENVRAFIGNGGNARWNMLIFKHNQQQVNDCEKLSKEMGFDYFYAVFSERWKDFNSEGEYRDITSLKVDDYVIEKPVDQKKDFIKIDPWRKNKDGFVEKQSDEEFFSRKINCLSCRPNRREIYIRANGDVSPCCILGDVRRNEPKQIIKDYKKINLHHTSLEDILDGEYFRDLASGIAGGEKRLKGCYHACGVK